MTPLVYGAIGWALLMGLAFMAKKADWLGTSAFFGLAAWVFLIWQIAGFFFPV